MTDRFNILSNLSEIFNLWQELLGSLSEKQIEQPLRPSSWTIKDVIAHLWSWQQASLARAEAALNDISPHYPDWWDACGPDPNEDVDRTNAFLYAACRDKSWTDVYTDWKKQFQQYLELLRIIPESDLLEQGRFVWMGNYALADSANGSWDHHQEHYEITRTWLEEHEGLEDSF